MQTRGDPRVFGSAAPVDRGAEAPTDLLALLSANEGRSPSRRASAKSTDIAFLVYTSGTTGVPKAAMISHGNVSFNGAAIATWYSLEQGDAILAMAPLFHVTGLVAHMALSWTLAAPLILCFRFEAGVVLDALIERRPALDGQRDHRVHCADEPQGRHARSLVEPEGDRFGRGADTAERGRRVSQADRPLHPQWLWPDRNGRGRDRGSAPP